MTRIALMACAGWVLAAAPGYAQGGGVTHSDDWEEPLAAASSNGNSPGTAEIDFVEVGGGGDAAYSPDELRAAAAFYADRDEHENAAALRAAADAGDANSDRDDLMEDLEAEDRLGNFEIQRATDDAPAPRGARAAGRVGAVEVGSAGLTDSSAESRDRLGNMEVQDLMSRYNQAETLSGGAFRNLYDGAVVGDPGIGGGGDDDDDD